MSTNAVIMINPEAKSGVFVHGDGYPSHTAFHLGRIVNEVGIEAARSQLAHPQAGYWSQIDSEAFEHNDSHLAVAHIGWMKRNVHNRQSLAQRREAEFVYVLTDTHLEVVTGGMVTRIKWGEEFETDLAAVIA